MAALTGGQKVMSRVKEKSKIEVYCWNCGAVFNAIIRSQTMHVICIGCMSKEVYTTPNKNMSHQVAHYNRLMKDIRQNIKDQGCTSGIYTPTDDWLKTIYGN